MLPSPDDQIMEYAATNASKYYANYSLQKLLYFNAFDKESLLPLLFEKEGYF